MNSALYALLIASVLLISGCAQVATSNNTSVRQSDIDEEKFAKGACISRCMTLLSSGANLANGPCLLNPIPDTDWVCDVAHSLRADVDNFPENQCSSYGTAAKHFVEVTPACEFIRAA